jgi:hypothetical protein
VDKPEYPLKYAQTKISGTKEEKSMSTSSNDGTQNEAANYRLKLSTIALIAFLAIATVSFYLRSTGIISDLIYYALLVSLIVVALILTFVFGKISKKRYSST